MKKCWVSFVLVALIVACSDTNKTNFSGTWKLNAEKSNLGEQRAPGGVDHGNSSPRPENDKTWRTDSGAPDSSIRPQRPEGRPGGPGGFRGRGMAGQFTLKQSGNKLVIERNRRNFAGEETTTEESYTLDGKECENESRMGVKTSVCTWSPDGKSLTMESTTTVDRDGQSMEMNSVDIYSLESGSLVIESTMETPMGERKTKMVYEKK